MATPLTDGINALTQYANETTGKQDTTLSDAVGSLVEGYGGDNKISPESLKKAFEDLGYVFSDYTLTEYSDSGYTVISHNLGRTPVSAVGIRKEFKPTRNGYQVGATAEGYIGKDNSNNRTAHIFKMGLENGLFDQILSNSVLALDITSWNFTRNATDTTIEIRNSNNNNNVKPIFGEWWLGVK